MAISMNSVSKKLSMPPVVVVLSAVSVLLALASLALSIASLLSVHSTGERTNHSPWFDLIISVITLLFHGVSIIIVVRRTSSRQSRNESFSEKGLINVQPCPTTKHLWFTHQVITWVGLIFAVWIVAAGSSVYEILLHQSWNVTEQGLFAVVLVETLLMACFLVYVFVGRRKSRTAAHSTKNRFMVSFGGLPRPLVLGGSDTKSNIEKESISGPSAPPAVLPMKLSPTSAICPPGNVSAPLPALRPEPRFNGMRTLVLVDPRMGPAAPPRSTTL